jgi:plasmid stability protein
MKSIVTVAEHTAPRFNDVFLEYAQSRGFSVDAARVRTPTDKPRVERAVPYVRQNFFAGEVFRDLEHARAMAETWCRDTAGVRIHGTTQLRPIETFRAEELGLLLPAPGSPFDTPVWSDPKVHRDLHVEVDRALYSVPRAFLGERLKARRDATTVKLYARGELVKLHPRVKPGQRSSDPADFPEGTSIYATRDVESLVRMAAQHGRDVEAMARAVLEHPLPWTKMRQVYRLVGLAKKWGSPRLNDACRRALEAESTDVNLVSRMLERARESSDDERFAPVVIPGRFARNAGEFTSRRAHS